MRKLAIFFLLLFITSSYAQDFEVWAERGGAFTVGKPERIIVYVKNNDMNGEYNYGVAVSRIEAYCGSPPTSCSNAILVRFASNKILSVKPNETKSTAGTIVILGPVTSGSIELTVAKEGTSQTRKITLSDIRAYYPQSLREFDTMLLLPLVFLAILYLRKNKYSLLLALMLSISIASSSYISITNYVDVPIIFYNQTNATIRIENSGDESAYDVTVSLDSRYFSSEAIYIGRIDSLQSISKNFTIFIPDGLKEGKYAAAVRVYYKDANGYSFSAITPIEIVYKTPAASKVSISVKNLKIEENGNGKIAIKLKNDEGKDVDASVNLYLPNEFMSSKTSYQISLKANSEKTILAEVTNFNALKGSSYPYFVVAEYEDEYHRSSYSLGFIEVVERQKIKLPYILAGMALLVSLALFFYSRKERKRKR